MKMTKMTEVMKMTEMMKRMKLTKMMEMMKRMKMTNMMEMMKESMTTCMSKESGKQDNAQYNNINEHNGNKKHDIKKQLKEKAAINMQSAFEGVDGDERRRDDGALSGDMNRLFHHSKSSRLLNKMSNTSSTASSTAAFIPFTATSTSILISRILDYNGYKKNISTPNPSYSYTTAIKTSFITSNMTSGTHYKNKAELVARNSYYENRLMKATSNILPRNDQVDVIMSHYNRKNETSRIAPNDTVDFIKEPKRVLSSHSTLNSSKDVVPMLISLSNPSKQEVEKPIVRSNNSKHYQIVGILSGISFVLGLLTAVGCVLFKLKRSRILIL